MTSARNRIAKKNTPTQYALFVSEKTNNILNVLSAYEGRFDKKLKALLVVDTRHKAKVATLKTKRITPVLVNFGSDARIAESLKPYGGQVIAATCHSESLIPFYQKIVPHLPYLRTPTETSLEWSTDKLKMRQMLNAYDKSITPRFTVVSDATDNSIAKIQKQVGFPLVVKPTGLAQSLLVSQCYYPEELKKVLQVSLKRIEKIYKEKGGRGIPQMLVEQMMEGSMYSIDAYVDAKGEVYFCPLVYVETGKAAGFDDFFGYKRITPAVLKPHKQQAARDASRKGIYALGLRNSTCHIELMKTEQGWKIIEMGPRMGGFRNRMYRMSFGIDHALNDLLIHTPQKPVIPKKPLGFSCVMQFFSTKEGVLDRIVGIKRIQSLGSMRMVKVKKKKGDFCRFARNGGTSVVDVALFNKKRPELLADIRKLETSLEIKVQGKKSKA